MAVYRSDQAQFTFAPEAGHGGYPEAATAVTAATSGDAGAGALDAATHSDTTGFAAGSRQIIVDDVSGSPTTEFQVGDYIQIGTAANEETEIRRCEFVSQDDPAGLHCTITLDAPTAFFHADNEVVTIVTATTEATTDKFISWVPGVYETVDTPDPEMAIEGRYLLGVGQKRNFLQAYKGQQTFSGSVGSFVLLNGWPLRFPIGKVTSTAVGGTHTERTTLAADAKKGDYQITVTSASGIVVGDMIAIDGHQFSHATGVASSNVSFSNQNIAELREVVAVNSTVLRLNYPLQFDHRGVGNQGFPVGLIDGADNDSTTSIVIDTLERNATTASDIIAVGDYLRVDNEVIRVVSISSNTLTVVRAEGGTTAEIFEDDDVVYKISSVEEIEGTPDYYHHNIYETIDLDTMSWNVHMRDSAENVSKDFNRRWFGGHCGSMSISADEGGLLTAGWDSVTFQDMVHNQKLHSVYASGAGNGLPGHEIMQQISSPDIGVPAKDGANGLTAAHGGFPSSDPYYFSQGSLTIHGVEFARVRNFSISVSNAEEPRYYINNQGKGTRRHRGPSEIRENQREYSMSASIALPDSVGATTSSRAIFKELILEGDYGTDTPGTANASDGMSGFAVTLTFTRATNDTITITIPNDGTAAEGAGEQGAFIRSAPHGITGDNPLQTDVDILFRNMKIQIKDSEPFYP
tara:strand:- start:2304 stop:4373 length:2070 start_codon:yes stop_codon:yes gene_type:complete